MSVCIYVCCMFAKGFNSMLNSGIEKRDYFRENIKAINFEGV